MPGLGTSFLAQASAWQAAADAGSEGREFPIPCGLGTGWIPAPAYPDRGWVSASACPRRMQGVLGLAAVGAELGKAGKCRGNIKSAWSMGSRVERKARSGQPRLALQGCL